MSKKKWVFIGVGALVILLGLVTTFFIVYGPKKRITLPSALTTLQLIKGEVSGDLVYEDASGFSFKYPKDIKVSDITPDEENYYTQLSLENSGQEMKVSMLDTTYQSLDEWLEEDSEAPKGATLIGAVSLDGVSARQYSFEAKLLTAAIDQEVLYLIESPKDELYWDKVHELFISSFAFAEPEPAAGGASGGNVIYEAEEVIE